MADLISRQAVMDATKAVMKDVLDSLPIRLEDGEEVYDVRTSELDFILNTNKALQNAIKALPSETHEIRTDTHGVCSDTISRQAAIDAIEHVTWYHQNRNGQMVSGANSDEHQAWYKAEDVYEAIEAVPAANKSGHWIDDGDCSICSKCHEAYGLTSLGQLYTPNFCPNCGADMKGADDE